ncbi:hypothetical protein ACFO0A_15150 [Novosphingobium tardum]|uniref:Uncharacterized protein n=1 Tax=Novosphingobium tardum TaxID=1538021 RepID=A0ABV8RSK8_9SPHN
MRRLPLPPAHDERRALRLWVEAVFGPLLPRRTGAREAAIAALVAEPRVATLLAGRRPLRESEEAIARLAAEACATSAIAA